MRGIALLLSLLFNVNLLQAQQIKDTLSVSFTELSLEAILDSVSFKTGYFFSYNAEVLSQERLISYSREHVVLDTLLRDLLVGTDLSVVRYEDQIIIKSNTLDGKLKNAQISGCIMDAEENPLVGVHVFLDGTTIGGYSDSNGRYLLTDIPAGNFTLVISHIGYCRRSCHLDLSAAKNHTINTVMEEEVVELPNIEVVASTLRAVDTSKIYSLFKEEFLGNSQNAYRCELINPEVLEYEITARDTFRVVTRQPLVMDNRALGYRVTFEIEYFDYKRGTTGFHVNASFEELEAENSRIRKRWDKNRTISYYGSSFHFFTSLLNNNLAEEGFELYHVRDIKNIQVDRLESVTGKSIVVDNGFYKKRISFPDHLMIVYTNEVEDARYQREKMKHMRISMPVLMNNSIMTEQKSFMTLKTGGLEVFNNGQVVDPQDLLITGYWSWERMADLVPIDFNPKKDKH